MKRQTMTLPVVSTTHQQVETLPCWDKLPPERRQSVIIALATMMVKCLPKRQRPREGCDE
jgi:hypothetical protein